MFDCCLTDWIIQMSLLRDKYFCGNKLACLYLLDCCLTGKYKKMFFHLCILWSKLEADSETQV
jgi:hypothetical protein